MAYHICGEKPLTGEISVQGSKNGALPLLAASLLIRGKTILKGCPDISDVRAMLALLRLQGCEVTQDGKDIIIDATKVIPGSCPKEFAKAMRSSIMLLGPLVARCGYAYVSRPGGCQIGKRPIDMHIAALQAMGARFYEQEDEMRVQAPKLTSCEIDLPFPSVGVTETVILAGVLAEGNVYLQGAATEPEITQLCDFLIKAGAKMEGIGTRRLLISGKSCLNEVEYAVAGDRIVAGTYLLGAVATRGHIRVSHIKPYELGKLLEVLGKMGCSIQTMNRSIEIDAKNAGCSIPYIKTEVFPGFPTDLQSMLAVCLTTAEGNSVIEETIFEDRFKIVTELWKMGAQITVDGNRMMIRHTDALTGACVEAQDLRGGAALILAGLMAKGETIVSGRHYIERGYEDIARDFRMLGADIEEISPRSAIEAVCTERG